MQYGHSSFTLTLNIATYTLYDVATNGSRFFTEGIGFFDFFWVFSSSFKSATTSANPVPEKVSTIGVIVTRPSTDLARYVIQNCDIISFQVAIRGVQQQTIVTIDPRTTEDGQQNDRQQKKANFNIHFSNDEIDLNARQKYLNHQVLRSFASAGLELRISNA